MWTDRKGWASRAPLSRLQLLGAAGTAEGGNTWHEGKLLLEPLRGRSPPCSVWLLQVGTVYQTGGRGMPALGQKNTGP